jgi:uncharacterized protein with von Willebrand factor type A (vWA) domain
MKKELIGRTSNEGKGGKIDIRAEMRKSRDQCKLQEIS